jgi:hypothetical protein
MTDDEITTNARSPLKGDDPMPNHYLISIPLGPKANLHGYVMCKSRSDTEQATNQMLDLIEQNNWPMPLPMILLTELSTGADLVRQIVAETSGQAARALKQATDFHFTCFMMPDTHPCHARLMALH